MSVSLAHRRWIYLVLLIGLGMMLSNSWVDVEEELSDMPDEIDFGYHIQPILSQNCYSCHGNDPSTRKAGLRLDHEEAAKSKLESGTTAIIGGSLKSSTIIRRITSTDSEIQMPPPESKKVLTKREIALLKKWVKQGAPYQKHWAFIKPKLPVVNSDLASNVPSTIDHFITEGIDYKKLSKGKQATKNELIRRVAYLITGLPPSIQELESYLNDNTDNAYETMVDSYLSSAAYGERWARHWMDLVRYGESMGHEGDFNISHAYEYRDYLIRAFNQDVPYDQLVKEHLAGDMMVKPRLHPTESFNESHLGTGYFFLGDGKHSPVDTKLEEADRIDNIIDVTTKTFQSLTVACARCHDHKFDPIPTADYYSMYGMIESSRLMPRPARAGISYDQALTQLKNVKEELKKEIIAFIKSNSQEPHQSMTDKEEFVVLDNDTSAILLAEFRDGNWEGWYTTGLAFGDKPVQGELSVENDALFRKQNIINKRWTYNSEKLYLQDLSNAETQKAYDIRPQVLSGFASSRAHSPGVQGILHSPNFIIEHDTIAIRARGLNGNLRVIVDNFQVIQNPLWGGCQKVVTSQEWKTYKMDVHLAKGHKAYLQFMPGQYDNHIYNITPHDYLEIKWAAAYSGNHDISRYNLAMPPGQTTSSNVDELIESWNNGTPGNYNEDRINDLFDDPQFSDIVTKRHERIEQAQNKLFDATHFIGISEGESIQSPVFIRGSHNELEEEKQSHRFLSAIEIDEEFPVKGSGRMAWANSLVSADNPLTTRVIVNRLWHHLFGKGIVETVDNFGVQGKIPSHPELLDYLSIQFVKDGWSIKTTLKNIMLSETFKRSAKLDSKNKSIDTENIYLSSFPIRRLESEAIRDGILAVAGCLDRQMFGEGVPVYLSSFMTGRGRPGLSGPIDSYGRRSIYREIRRNFIPEMMLTFDMPIPFSTFGRRNVTNVPAQSLTLMNNPFVHEQAEYWAENLLLATASLGIEDRIREIYLTAFSRTPTPQEMTQGLEFITMLAQDKQSNIKELKDDVDLWKAYCHAIFNLKEFIHLI